VWFGKISKMNFLVSFFRMKCPRCRQGNLFLSPFKFTDPVAMPEQCAVCGQKTMPEPGYYYGAMFVSYVVTGFLYLGLAFILHYILKLSLPITFTLIILFTILTYFQTLRLSRSLWIHLMIDYDPNAGIK